MIFAPALFRAIKNSSVWNYYLLFAMCTVESLSQLFLKLHIYAITDYFAPKTKEKMRNATVRFATTVTKLAFPYLGICI